MNDFDRIRAALESAGIDASEFGRFVNRPFAGVLEPAVFDTEASAPVLVEMLPSLSDDRAKDCVVRHLAASRDRGLVYPVLLALYRSTGNESGLKWVVADGLRQVATDREIPTLRELARDVAGGTARQPLLDRIGRSRKDPESAALAEELLDDPTVALAAMSALRSQLGPDRALPLLRLRLISDDDRVRQAAGTHVKRIERAVAKRRQS